MVHAIDTINITYPTVLSISEIEWHEVYTLLLVGEIYFGWYSYACKENIILSSLSVSMFYYQDNHIRILFFFLVIYIWFKVLMKLSMHSA